MSRRQSLIILLLLCGAELVAVLDISVVNVALTSIQDDLGMEQELLAWVVNAYSLVFGSLLLLGGRLSDVLGRRRTFLAGLTLFVVASAACGLAQSPGVLIGARAVQGIGAALLTPSALSLLTTTFPEGPERTRALAAYSGVAAAGGAVGLVLGGVLSEALTWRWAFYINVPIGLIVGVGVLRLLPEVAGSRGKVDVAGAILAVGGLASLLLGITQGERTGFGSTETIALLVAAVALLTTFIVVEGRVAVPLLPLRIVAIRSVWSANLSLLIVGTGLFGSFYLLSLLLQQVLDYSPLEAGLATLPLAVVSVLGAVLVSALVPRFGVKPPLLAGLVLTAVGLALLGGVTPNTEYASSILPAMLVLAAGLGLAFLPLTILATSGVPSEDAGIAGGLYTTAQELGGSVGLAILATLATARTERDVERGTDELTALADGFALAFSAGAVAVGFALVAVLFLIRNYKPRGGVALVGH